MHRLRPLPLVSLFPPSLRRAHQLADVLRKFCTTNYQKCLPQLDYVMVNDNGSGPILYSYFTAGSKVLKTNATLLPDNLFFNYVYLLFWVMIQIVGGTLIV